LIFVKLVKPKTSILLIIQWSNSRSKKCATVVVVMGVTDTRSINSSDKHFVMANLVDCFHVDKGGVTDLAGYPSVRWETLSKRCNKLSKFKSTDSLVPRRSKP
jgi:hypothetical protein